MEKVIHRAASRGFADHGWLKSYSTFSYGNYYDPRRIHFGALRIMNDDTVEGGEGYSSHPHDNMEVIVFPIEGAMEHGDNMGYIDVVEAGQILVITSGTGIVHNEYNKSQTEPLKCLKMWLYPKEYELPPAYSQAEFAPPVPNELRLITAPYGDDSAGDKVARIAQDAWFYVADVEPHRSVTHHVHNDKQGTYVFVIEGEIRIGDTVLRTKDGMGVWETDEFTIEAETPAKLFLMEVPMKK